MLIFVQIIVLHAFFTILHRFSRKINEKVTKKSMHFFTASFAFLKLVTLTKHRILRYESYFFIFCILVFFPKSIGKMTPKFKPHSFPQKHQKVVPGNLFWVPKWCRINVGEINHLENCSKKSFFDRPVFRIFF